MWEEEKRLMPLGEGAKLREMGGRVAEVEKRNSVVSGGARRRGEGGGK